MTHAHVPHRHTRPSGTLPQFGSRARAHRALVASFALAVVALSGCGSDEVSRVLRVEPGSSITDTIATARPGDVVVIADGTYHESVKVTVPRITVRGESRNGVILDGEHTLTNGIVVTVDGVAVENLTVHSFTQNGVLFNGIEAAAGGRGVEPGVVYGTGDDVLTGYRASYVTAYNNGLYGIYAFASRDGLIEHSYVSGHPDSGIYVGQCDPCNVVVRDVVAELNAIGYYGTNASGDVYVVESTFTRNRLGIAPNSQRAERLAPQRATVVAGNLVIDNDDPDAPPIPKGFFGVGIAVGGGTENVVVRNRVEGHVAAGIALLTLGEFSPVGNRVEGNVLAGNGVDLAYAPVDSASATGNCFTGNVFETSLPVGIETTLACPSTSSAVTEQLELPEAPPGGDYRTTPAPPTQPEMPAEEMPATGGATAPPTVDLDSIRVPER